MQHINYIIVGQGIAGSLLAYELIKHNQKVLIINHPNPASSTQVAAGIILPVTGRRMVKTWKADETITYAFVKYLELEKLFNRKLFYEKPIVEIFSSVKNANDWKIRSGEGDVQKYLGKIYSSKELPDYIHAPYGAIELLQAGYLNTTDFLACFYAFFRDKNCLINEKIISEQLRFTDDSVQYKNYYSDKIIFCEGASSIQNKLLPTLPWQLSKGEMLLIRCEELSEGFIFNHGIFICPIGNHLFKVGSTYEWNDLTESPTEEAQLKLKEALDKILKTPYVIENQLAAIRPTVKERRPFVGLLRNNKQLGIFNGLGTKGVLLAPFFADQFAQHLVNGTKLDSEVDVNRFSL